MSKWETVSVVGVGLIGGSIGLALQQRKLATHVVGVGRRESSLQIARQAGAITRSTTDLQEGVADAQLIVVCTPVQQVVAKVQEVMAASGDRTWITDAGSTKQTICAAMDGEATAAKRFVGSHPLAGSERTGPQHADADLFVNRQVIVTPTKQSSPESVQQIVTFWETLGAVVTMMSPQAHDQTVAATSHVPHLVAAALAAATPAEHLSFTASGWLDTTRVAGGGTELWRQILADNRNNVLASLADFQTVLDQFRTALQSEDQDRIRELLETGKTNRDSVGS